MIFRKMISFVLSLGIIISTLSGFTVVNAAGEGYTTFTNLIENGNMEDVNNIKWEPSTSVTGAKITIETDTKDLSNHVLRFDGTGITDGIVSNANYNNVIKNGKKYYYSYKIRVADNDTNEGALYSSNSNFGAVNNLTRPKIIKGKWATRSGVFTATKDNSFNFKISNAQDKTTGTNNVAKVIYELDNVVIYEFDDIYELILPENTTILEGGKTLEVTNNATELRQIKKHYAKAGDKVKLEYKGIEGLGIEGTEVTADGNTYTFVMPSADTTVILTAPATFTNLIENGNMEDVNNIKWEPSTSVTGAKITIETDTKDLSNHVLRFDGTGITDGIVSNANYNNVIKNGKKYYYSYKIRVADNDTNEGALYSSNSNFGAVNNLTRPKIIKGKWATRSGVFTATKDNSFNFKISNAQDKTTGTNNVAKVIYELDNVVIYEFDDIYELILPENTTILEGGKTLEVTNNATELRQIKKHYAKAGDKVKLEYKGIESLGVEGTEVTADGNTYTFVMSSADTTVTLIAPPAYTNLIENGDMEGEYNNWKAAGSVTGAVVKIVKDSKESGNHVLQYDGSNANGSISYVAYNNTTGDFIQKDSRYYYSYKIRIADACGYEGALHAYNSNHAETSELDRPEISGEWITRSGVFTAKANNSYNFKITNNVNNSSDDSNVPKVIYELDDVVIYDFNKIYEINLAENINVTEGGKVLDVTENDLQQAPNYFAEVGEVIELEYNGEEILSFAGVNANTDGNIYTFEMPGNNVTVRENISFDNAAQNPYVIVAKPRNFVIVAAEYYDKTLVNAYTASCATTNDNQIVSLKDIEEFTSITDWEDMRIYVWNNFADITPLCDSFICEK